MDSKLRIAVVGCGRMGQLHLQALQQVEDFHLVAIVEPCEEKRAVLQELHACKAYATVEEIHEPLDAVTIATPSSTHHAVAKYFLEKGIPCLVEKPLALHPNEAEELLALEKSVPILVGYSERYNPTFLELQRALEGQVIRAISARRLSYAPNRHFDADVMLDLMVHDIDLVLALVKRSPVTSVQGQCIRTDHCDALVRFENGVTANLIASRMTPCRVRELTVTTATNFYRADLLNHSLEVSVEAKETTSILPRHHEQPLVAQYNHFRDVIRRQATPNICASQAHQGLTIIWKLQHALLGEPV